MVNASLLLGDEGMKKPSIALLAWVAVLGVLAQAREAAAEDRFRWLRAWQKANPAWRGVHVMVQDDKTADSLAEQLPSLARAGVNAVVVEVDYAFAFASHPRLRTKQFVTRESAARLARAARRHGIRPIPLFNCLGHQSSGKTTFPLLLEYPAFDETPGQFPGNAGIYARSWCPRHTGVNRVVLALIDELIGAFQADAFHVGMDEVFLIASEHCPRCKGGDPAELFAGCVKGLHAHLVSKRKLEMLLWGDRLLDARALGYSKDEAAANGTHRAIDLIPKDVVVCDWHYERHKDYRSIPLLLGKGFRVWPAGWKSVANTEALIDAARRHRGKGVLGHLCTTWGQGDNRRLARWPPLVAAMRKWAR
jgi:hypothetical protein